MSDVDPTRDWQEAHTQLIEQNRRFDAALENMSQGLTMFDAEGRLLVWNRRYLDIFGLVPEHLHVGMTQRAILESMVSLGRYKPGITVDALCESTRRELINDASCAILRELEDGRTIAMTQRSMVGGGWVATFEDITERRRYEARIVHMAHHDALTDLPNRHVLHERCGALLERLGEMPGQSVAVFCLDLDRFKCVNDGFGHAVGDLLLRAVSERLQRSLRRSDGIARIGGDEFAVLRLVPDEADAIAFAQRLIRRISQPYRIDGRRLKIGTSVGITIARRNDLGIDVLLTQADMALYAAKASGRGTHCVFEPRMDASARARRDLEAALRYALVADQIALHYQPIVAVDTGQITAVEALMRWTHPEEGRISPDVFIPLAEEIGLIALLGEWAIRKACSDAARWPASVRVAVNVSALQLHHLGFVPAVIAALAASGLPPARLELEITETVLLDDTQISLDALHTLRRLGVRISMDDFGTGYSSISYLRRFPFDKIKIDRAFVRDADTQAEARAIIRAIVGLGVSLGITTLVEGVETQAQFAVVRAEGAQEMQGFLVSQPRPAEEITAMLASQATAQAAALASPPSQ